MSLPLIRESQLALRHAATAWLEQDPDDATRAELSELLGRLGDVNAVGEEIADDDTSDRAEAWREVRDRFATRLQFGTAGLRGRQGAGSNRMNRVVVAQAARGLADFLLARGEAAPSVVIGYDARRHSATYARDTAELMQAAGVRATLLPSALPTPVTAFAVRHLDASAGVMVTASHNPKWDNGYKVYLGGADNGSQIVPPADAEIAAAIAAVASVRKVNELPRDTGYAVADASLVDAYVEATAKVLRHSPVPLKVAYTAMHGVGWNTYRRVLETAGIGAHEVVREQIEPDGTFPTVDFPNPEEPGALDLAYETASRVGAQLIIAHDPDADRLAVAESDGAGGWHLFGGNDIGKLLGWRAAKIATEAGASGTLATSLVSSPALSKVAEHYGLGYAETQTGFKWISRADGIIYGYEEALGYLVNAETVRDKDGLSAALAVLDLAFAQSAEGKTLQDLDDEFGELFGAFASRQVALRFDDPAQLPAVMASVRATPPTQVGAAAVAEVHDFETDAQPANIVRLVLDDGTRLMIRPSGTEPKIKVYIDAVSTDGTLGERRASANERADAAAGAMRALLS
ncbi:phospho-sugar mutase [Gulosibacter sediminis]|uniref:phospho-sugar mutase n=1 Tax=Gulosibacter sediminis TaxID=1729695 RepID=UPI0024AE04E2|nr:phospho-sugar mutase [Gulosibacter sediminis]